MTRSSRSKTRPKPDPPAGAPVRLTFEAIGTHWQIDMAGVKQGDAARLRTAILERIGNFDRQYSRFRQDSLVAEMARRAGTYRLPDDAGPLFDMYREMYLLTDGAMTPLAGQMLADAGYDASYSLREGEVSHPPAWEEVMEYDFPELRLSRPAMLDFGAAGKGYVVDLVASLLDAEGCDEYCVDAGGDMVRRGPEDDPLRVGLEHPDEMGMAIGVAYLRGGALCGSAGNRRAWGRFHHVIDPRSLRSPTHIRALWVTAGSALLADALTTALYFASPEVLGKRYNFEYAIIHEDYSLRHSAGFPAEFFAAPPEGS